MMLYIVHFGAVDMVQNSLQPSEQPITSSGSHVGSTEAVDEVTIVGELSVVAEQSVLQKRPRSDELLVTAGSDCVVIQSKESA